MYLKIMPPWLPWHSFLVLLSGILEILFGCLLLIPSTRRAGAWGLIFLLIAVFPANIQMTLNYWKEGHPQFWITILRLPVQILLIAWAYWYTRRKGS